ncbi:MAG: hypothetical protein PSX71_00195 [bacterium]|nr:hypothetical protein [bacterium]
MRRFLNTATLCSLMLSGVAASTAAMAAPAATAASPQVQTIRTLQHLETISYKAGTAFYLYSVLNRDPQEYKKMQAQISAGDGVVQKLGNNAISPKWNDFKHSLTAAKFTTEGVADNTSINAIDGALSSLTQTIRTSETEQKLAGKVSTDKMADMLYEQYVLMEVMTAAYLRKSADYFGGSIVASQGPEVEIDLLADKFSQQLLQLNRYYAKTPQVAQSLKEITTKWTFIKNSFKNFNKDNVPFIVGRYNEQITEKLLAAHESLM